MEVVSNHGRIKEPLSGPFIAAGSAGTVRAKVPIGQAVGPATCPAQFEDLVGLMGTDIDGWFDHGSGVFVRFGGGTVKGQNFYLPIDTAFEQGRRARDERIAGSVSLPRKTLNLFKKAGVTRAMESNTFYVRAPSINAVRRALGRAPGGVRVAGRHDRETVAVTHTMNDHSYRRHWPVILSRLSAAGLEVVPKPSEGGTEDEDEEGGESPTDRPD